MNYVIGQLQKNKNIFESVLSDVKDDVVLWKPSPEKWCLLEIVCHLFDEEQDDFRFRVKWTIENPNQVPPSINPKEWVTKHSYMNQNYKEILSKFILEREQSILWLKSLNNTKWNHAFEHSKLGTLSAKFFLENWLAHDYLHLRQILKIKFDYLKHQSGESLEYAGIW